jgi:hypothetical protein
MIEDSTEVFLTVSSRDRGFARSYRKHTMDGERLGHDDDSTTNGGAEAGNWSPFRATSDSSWGGGQHDPGGNKMYHDLKATYWWYGMKSDVTRYVALCTTCQ